MIWGARPSRSHPFGVPPNGSGAGANRENRDSIPSLCSLGARPWTKPQSQRLRREIGGRIDPSHADPQPCCGWSFGHNRAPKFRSLLCCSDSRISIGSAFVRSPMMAMPRKPLSLPRAKWARGALAGVAALALPILALAEDRKTSEEDKINWAKERQFWSFRAPVPQARPEVKNRRWPSQRLDYFVLARMERKSFSPSPEADKRTLIRRATFDLTGLPPTPAEGLSFLANQRPDAYARLVD